LTLNPPRKNQPPENRLVDDCFQTSEKLIRHEMAINELKARTKIVVSPEAVALNDAGGRVLAEPAIAAHDVPPHANAAVDGYGFSDTDLVEGTETKLSVVGRSAAGQPYCKAIGPGQAVRILTGAVIPAGCNSIVMQEDVALSDDSQTVVLPAVARAGANIRPQGEDVAKGETLFTAGHLLRPQDLASLASIGVGTVQCFQRLKVGIISTGDEIKDAGSDDLKPGDVYNANTPMLLALVRSAGCEAHDLGIWPDQQDQIKDRLKEAAQTFDILITSGGASQGEEDHIAAALDALGQRHFWRIAVKPGRPIMFGQIDTVPVIGLPGNPVAVFVCFLMYVFPVLRSLGGAGFPEPKRIHLPACFEVRNRKPGRREFWRGTMKMTDDGARIDKYPKDGSGLISSLREANGLIDMPDDSARSVNKGDLVAFIPFSEFGILE